MLSRSSKLRRRILAQAAASSCAANRIVISRSTETALAASSVIVAAQLRFTSLTSRSWAASKYSAILARISATLASLVPADSTSLASLDDMVRRLDLEVERTRRGSG